MKKGFTLVEMIAIIIILSIVSILSFSSMTKTIKETDTKEEEMFYSQVKSAAQVYIETSINELDLVVNTGDTLEVCMDELQVEKFLTKNITNPTSCPDDKVCVRATKQADKTLKYENFCKN